MFSNHIAPPRKSEEGERPFWISYADLMTAMMVLFLVVMVVSVLSVTKIIVDDIQEGKDRARDIAELCAQLEVKAKEVNDQIRVDCQDNRIHFGETGRFSSDDYRLGAEGRAALQAAVPLILEVADSEKGKKWFKQVLIEGFTDTDGSYLYNLHLSLQRSEFVMCALLDDRYAKQIGLSEEQKRRVRELFLAGGVSFNNAKESKEASRRVELRMQFYGLKDDAQKEVHPVFNITKIEACRLR